MPKNRTTVERTCGRCGLIFHAAAYKVAIGRAKFCSVSCRYHGASFDERFWNRVDKCGPSPAHRPELGPCWVWIGTLDTKGYGVFGCRSRRTSQASRISLEIHLGRPLSDNEWALHHCDNPPCVRPSHLFAGPPKWNTADMMAKGRNRVPVGEQHKQAKLSEIQVREIRALVATGESMRSIGKRYGVSHKAVSGLMNGRTWKHVA